MGDSQLIQFACSAGINEAVRVESLDPAVGAPNLENIRQPQRGVYDKRFGFAARTATRTDATTRSAGYKLVSYNGVPCVSDGHQLDAWSVAASADMPRSRLPECVVTRRPMVSRQALMSPFGTRDSGDVASAMLNDVAYAGGYYIIVYVEQQDASNMHVVAAVCDATTGEAISTKVLPSSASATLTANVQVIAAGTDVVAFWDDGGATIYGSRLSVASAASIATGWGARHTFATDLGETFIYGACGLTTKGALLYGNTNGAVARLTVMSFDTTTNSLTTLQSGPVTTVNAGIAGLACAGDISDTLWLSWATGSSVVVEGRSATSITSVTATSQAILSLNASGGTRRVVVAWTGTGTGHVAAAGGDATVAGWYLTYARAFNKTAGATTAVGTENVIYGFLPASAPFVAGGRTYLEAFHDDTSSTASVLFDVTSYTVAVRPVAMAAPRLQSISTSQIAARHSVGVSSTKLATLQCIVSSAVSSALSVAEHDFAATNRWLPIGAAGSLLLSGGIPTAFDGLSAPELAFVVPPRVDVSSTGTGITGTFNYTALYEAVDTAGNIVWSDTAPVQVITVANKTVTCRVRTLSATWRYGTDSSPLSPSGVTAIRIKLYRTVNGGGLFYLIKTFVNDPTSAIVTFSDTTTDANLIAGAQPYRSPGVQGTPQPRQNPGCVHAWCEYNGMIVAVGDDKRTLWWTPQHVAGESIYFTDNFQQPLDQDGDTIALAAQDGACFAFKRRAIYAMAGETASDNGASGGLGTPRRLACDVGCIDARSIVVTSKGIFFQSDKGIAILTRAQTVEFIGEAVRVTTAAYPVCTAATLDAGQSRVYFELATTETSNQVSGTGCTLVYNLALDLWESKDRRYNSAGVADTPAQSAALIYTGTAWRYAWLGTDGIVYVEDQTSYLDPGSRWVAKLMESAYVKVSGLQGNQLVNSVILLAKSQTDHDLNGALRYDYDVYSAVQSKTAAQLTAIGLPNEQIEFLPNDDSECAAVGLKVYDATPSSGTVGTGQGALWIGTLFDIEPRPGPNVVPDGAR